MPIQFTVETRDLAKTLKPFFAGRARGKDAGLDYVDVKAQTDGVEFVSTGLSSSIGANVESSGCARIPYLIFENLFQHPQKLAADRLSIPTKEGEIKAGPTTFNHPGVTIQTVEARIADLPIDAPLGDTLALSFRFNAEELAQSRFWSRVQAAQRKTDDLIEGVTKLLEPLEITRDAIIRFVFQQIRERQAHDH